MRKSKLVGKIFLMVLAGFAILVICILFRLMPKKDHITVKDLPREYMILNEENRVKFQSGRDCSGYAVAYVLRHFGQEAEGPQIFEEMPKLFGKAELSCLQSVLKEYGYESTAYYGTIDTLKMQLTKGIPVIAFVTITLGSEVGKHYVAVIGYDEDYIYMADSTGAKTNIAVSPQYNRRLTYAEFEELWQTNSYPVNNIYIVTEKN